MPCEVPTKLNGFRVSSQVDVNIAIVNVCIICIYSQENKYHLQVNIVADWAV